jgi:hypothetical protein
MDAYHYPSKHTQVIMLVMERHDSERQEKSIMNNKLRG